MFIKPRSDKNTRILHSDINSPSSSVISGVVGTRRGDAFFFGVVEGRGLLERLGTAGEQLFGGQADAAGLEKVLPARPPDLEPSRVDSRA